MQIVEKMPSPLIPFVSVLFNFHLVLKLLCNFNYEFLNRFLVCMNLNCVDLTFGFVTLSTKPQIHELKT